MIILREKLAASEIHDVKAFIDDACAKSGLSYKIDVHTLTGEPGERSANVLYYVDGTLMGYTYIIHFRSDGTELTLISENPAVLREMIDYVLEENGNQSEKPMIIVNREDSILSSLLVSEGFRICQTENRLILDAAKFSATDKNKLHIRPAAERDAKLLSELHASAFGMETAIVISAEDLAATRLAEVNGEVVGALRLETDGAGVYGIYGVAVAPERQGCGIGRDFLSGIIKEIIEENFAKIFLEVDSENAPAQKLYANLGFVTQAVFDYYTK